MGSNIQSEGTLFQLAQLLRVFPDSKTMVDAIQHKDGPEINKKLDEYLTACAGDLQQLLGAAGQAGSTEQPDPQYQVVKIARRLNRLVYQLEDLIDWGFEKYDSRAKEPPHSASMESHIERMWWALTRASWDRRDGSNLVALRRPYLVAGGRYLELFYWDSYYTSLGLLASGRIHMLENIIENMAALIRQYRCVPNGTRTCFLTRSQAPHFAKMLRMLARVKGEDAARAYRDALVLEHEFWSSAQRTHVIPGSGNARLNHYWDDLSPQLSDNDELLHAMARPEGYREDIRTCYQAEDPGGGGEYPDQVGFGWTNGVVRACLKFLDEGVFWQEQAGFVR